MLTSFRLKNFKAWNDTGRIALAPLTIIFGANSAGKSSLGHWLLALKQTALSADRHRALHLGDDRSLVDLGTFAECLHGLDLQSEMSFALRWQLEDGFAVADPLAPDTKYTGQELSLDVTLNANSAGQPQVRALRYHLFDDIHVTLSATLERLTGGKLGLSTSGYKLMRTVGKPWPLDEPEKFYRISEASRARFQNADFLADLALSVETMLKNFYYLGPLRETPHRIYHWSGESPEDVGLRGEYTVAAILAAQAQGRKLQLGPRQRQLDFGELIAGALKRLGVITGFSLRPVAEGRKEFEVLVRSHGDTHEVKLNDVGFGVSQVLPAVVAAFYGLPNSTVWMEQPEIHLHPQVQANLADVLIDAIHVRENGAPRGAQLIVESHSEHLLNRLQRRIAERKLKPDEVAIYFCSRGRKGAQMERLQLDEDGEISNWPTDFFGDDMADIAGRTIAAMEHRKESAGGGQ
jgi:predicted ATPase